MKYLSAFILLLCAQGFIAQSAFANNKCVDLMQKEDFYAAADVCASMARKGDSTAQFALGVLYYQGNGVMADTSKAQKWMRKAAEQNHRQAQYNLGIMVANGQGSPADLVSAYAWLKVSADNGYEPAADSLKQLGAELSSTEKKEAEKKITDLKQQYKF